MIFNQELLALVKAGLPVLRVWDLLIERTQRTAFREALQGVRQDIRGGASASEALARHPQHFTDLYLATIRAGEQAGNLPEVLQRYITYLKLMIGLRQKVTKALAYPAFLIIVGVAVVGFLLSYVIPTFVSVYGESARSLPTATRMLIGVIHIGQAYIIPVIIVLGILVIAGRSWYRTAGGRLTVDHHCSGCPSSGRFLSSITPSNSPEPWRPCYPEARRSLMRWKFHVEPYRTDLFPAALRRLPLKFGKGIRWHLPWNVHRFFLNSRSKCCRSVRKPARWSRCSGYCRVL